MEMQFKGWLNTIEKHWIQLISCGLLRGPTTFAARNISADFGGILTAAPEGSVTISFKGIMSFDLVESIPAKPTPRSQSQR